MLWKLLAGAGFLALAAFLIVQFGDAREREGRADEIAARAQIDTSDAKNDAAARIMEERRVTDAVTAWGEAKDALKPLILTSHDTVTQYAATPAGAARCLGADRVLGLDAFDASLFPAATPVAADRGAGTVPAHPSPPAG